MPGATPVPLVRAFWISVRSVYEGSIDAKTRETTRSPRHLWTGLLPGVYTPRKERCVNRHTL
eukprot:scaffold100684_cov31-Tisochrysis_lutea.AAC.2